MVPEVASSTCRATTASTTSSLRVIPNWFVSKRENNSKNNDPVARIGPVVVQVLAAQRTTTVSRVGLEPTTYELKSDRLHVERMAEHEVDLLARAQRSASQYRQKMHSLPTTRVRAVRLERAKAVPRPHSVASCEAVSCPASPGRTGRACEREGRCRSSIWRGQHRSGTLRVLHASWRAASEMQNR